MRKGRDGNEYKEGIEDGTRVGGRGIEEYYFQKIFIQKRDESWDYLTVPKDSHYTPFLRF